MSFAVAHTHTCTAGGGDNARRSFKTLRVPQTTWRGFRQAVTAVRNTLFTCKINVPCGTPNGNTIFVFCPIVVVVVVGPPCKLPHPARGERPICPNPNQSKKMAVRKRG